ncbi:growth arrest and DNA damage-inducible protein GADD45 gamma-like [Acipenser ruthenus]|uniref:growth arrest and DNA damage-inducible protein GADD45 gamma-like n=1 Tax=Acipenser ruthenus TaxID=7906 RepID=UPI002740CCA5|nr:growth arrest and DNA damage-inducible protein GADD45 gamma-like [Acipenser ruthenus]
MTLEESIAEKSIERMQCAGKALEELLVSAQSQECLTAGVYESAKVMNVVYNPSLVLFFNAAISTLACCVLATDEEYECDISLQIHFTLIQAFCFDNGIDIVRVNDTQRLAEILVNTDESGKPKDVHCILITNPSEDTFEDPALEKLSLFCEECRSVNEWVPAITLPEH